MTKLETSPTLLVLGPGYTARPLMRQMKDKGWNVSGTYRTAEGKASLIEEDFAPIAFEADASETAALSAAASKLHVLISIAPTADGDPALQQWGRFLRASPHLDSLCYLSSTNVYGDHDGAWVDETTSPAPSLDRGKYRLRAEADWHSLAVETKARLFIFRLAGIYGPGRNALASLKSGKARSIIKPGQSFGRIHRTDITAALTAAITGPHKGGIFNLADDLPCPPHEVIEAAAALADMPAPARQNWEEADMSPMARSFYQESKKVRNDKVKTELGLTFAYPTYKEGLIDLAKTEI